MACDGKQEDAARWVADFLYPEYFKSAPKNLALREDRVRFVIEKQRFLDSIKNMRKQNRVCVEGVPIADMELQPLLDGLVSLRLSKCVLCKQSPLNENLSHIPMDTMYACIDNIRWDIHAVDPHEDVFCNSCMKWMHVYATCIIPREQTGIYADAGTIPLALQTLVQMNYN